MKRNNFYILLLMCLINIPLFSQGTWNWQNPQPQGNPIKCIHVFDSTSAIFVGEAGTIYKTTNGGTEWIAQSSGTSSNLQSVYFIDTNTGWAVGNTGIILKTTDCGLNWMSQTSGTTYNLSSVDFVDANIGWTVGSNWTVLKTTNGGTNWISQTQGGSFNCVDFVNANTGWAVGDNGKIIKTTNGGTDWVVQTSGITTNLLSVNFASASTGWAVGINGVILKTNDGGTNWTSQTSGTSFHLRSVKFININIGYIVGSNGKILKTTNGGTNWTSQTSGLLNTDLYSTDFADANTAWIVGGSGGVILKTINGGTNWTPQLNGTTNRLTSVYFINANIGWAVGWAGTIIKTTNGGMNWTSQTSGTTYSLNSINFIDENTGWAVGGSYGTSVVLKTTNGGTNWTTLFSSGSSYGNNSVYFIDANTGWYVGASGKIIKTTNGGTNWTLQTSGTTWELKSVYFVDANIGWVVGESGRVLKTTNGGTTWVSQSIGGVFSDINSVYFIDANSGWIAGELGRIMKTTDGGTNWYAQTSGWSSYIYSISFVDQNTGFAVGSNGKILKTNNGGASWSFQKSGTVNWLNSVNFVDANTGWAVGYDGTILKYTGAPGSYITLSAGIGDGLPGDTVIVPVNVDFPPNTSFSAFQINFGHPAQISFTGIDTANTLIGDAGWSVFANPNVNPVKTAASGANDINTAGTLMGVKYFIPDSVTSGDLPITIPYTLFNTGAVNVNNGDGAIIIRKFGDVDINNIVQAYDASLILKYLVNLVTLTPNQLKIADVSKDLTVSALDASLILQYIVGLIDTLPHTTVVLAEGNLAMNSGSIHQGQLIEVPVTVNNGQKIFSFEGKIKFDPEVLIYSGIDWGNNFTGFTKEVKVENGRVIISGASTLENNNVNNVFIKLKFTVKTNISAVQTTVTFEKLRWNENQVVQNAAAAVFDITTGIEDVDNIPTEYSLAQNYPNPFNPSTTIKFDLPEASHVTLKIYNVMGELVQVLIDEEKPAGYHHVIFDTAGLSSGIYFYRINAGSYKEVKKMILAK